VRSKVSTTQPMHSSELARLAGVSTEGLTRLLSADLTRHDTLGRQIDGYERLEVIGVTRDSKFDEEGGLKLQVLRKARITRENAAIALTTASLQFARMKSREVPRSAKKPKKWRKTVARSSPEPKAHPVPVFKLNWRRQPSILAHGELATAVDLAPLYSGGLLIHPNLFARTDFRLFC
jgi:hypothetical protein